MRRLYAIIIGLLTLSSTHAMPSFGDELLHRIAQNNALQHPESTLETLNQRCQEFRTPTQRYDQDTQYVYDASQSLFLKALCQYEDLGDYLQHTDHNYYGINCRGSYTADECAEPIYEHVHTIYDTIMRDIIDTLTAQAYGMDPTNLSGTSLEDLTYQLLASYHPQRSETTKLCASKEECDTPDTHQYIVSSLRQARNLLISRPLLQHDIPSTPQCTLTDRKNDTYTIIPCGLSYTSTLTHQYNLISNEMLWYTLFVEYYAHHLTHTPALQPNSPNNTNINHTINQGKQQATTLINHYYQSIEASRASIHHISQIHTTFRTHIHLLAYYEMTKELRNQLARVYTPLHQLYYKLRNVQAQS